MLLPAALGCRDEIQSPTEPAATTPPGTAIAAATALAFWQVSGGQDHTCGVTTDWLAYCWGDNFTGRLGLGTSGDDGRLTPAAVVGGLRFKQVSAGESFSCGVTIEELAYCWGDNSVGQLGNGTLTGPERCDPAHVPGGKPCSTRPAPVAGGLRFAQIAVGSEHTCAVSSSDRRAYCWGRNLSGQLGDGTTTLRLQPVAVAGGRHFRQVSSGYTHTCGVTTDDKAFCWGGNNRGQLGDSTNVGRLRPTEVSGHRQFQQLAAGRWHSCGVTTTGRAFCWGDGRSGQLGNGKAYLSYWPRAVAGGLVWTRVTVGRDHSCGETSTNQAYCWGFNLDGELGNGTVDPHLSPVAVAGGLAFKQVSAGWAHTCGKTAAGVLYCWGLNASGQLGDGTQMNRLTPARVAGAM